MICTPTLVSKYDLTPEDLCLVDLEGKQVAGIKPRTSEIFLHLEIYKEVPEAKSVVHCHPPHATAYAITGRVPPNLVIPEFEVFVGKVAISPYETPGTTKFAQTVLPFVRDHNTVLLANHGIVCWADTVTHAEWYAEVLETYCWTLMLAVAAWRSHLAHIGAAGRRPAGHQEDAWPARHPLRHVEAERVPALRSRCARFHRAHAEFMRMPQRQAYGDGSRSAGQVGHGRSDGSHRDEVNAMLR